MIILFWANAGLILYSILVKLFDFVIRDEYLFLQQIKNQIFLK